MSQLDDEILRFRADMSKTHEFVHGHQGSVITTEGGVVPTLAKLVADKKVDIDQATAVFLVGKSAEINESAEGILQQTKDVKTQAEGVRDSINNRLYPGIYTQPPTTRPNGSAIGNGDMYSDATYTYVRRSGVWVNYEQQAAATAQAVTLDKQATATSLDLAQTAREQAVDANIAAQEARVLTASALAAAQDAVIDAQAIVTSFDTLAEAEAAVTTVGKFFAVRQQFGKGLYIYKRLATGSEFLFVMPFGIKAREWVYKRALRGTLTPNIPNLVFDLWGSDGLEWDCRVIPNRVSQVLPTLNIIPDPFSPLDEVGTTPTQEVNTTATTDNLGTNYALKLTSTAQSQQVTVWRSSYGVMPLGTYRLRIDHKQLPGGVSTAKDQWRLGQNSALGELIVPSTSVWNTTEEVLSNYDGTSTDLGFSSALNNTDGVVAIANFAMYDDYAGNSSRLPSFTQELAAQKAGHMKRFSAYAGSFSLTPYGSVDINGSTGAFIISLDPGGLLLSEGYTFGGWFESTELGSVQSLAFSFDFHARLTGGATGLAHGQFGHYGAITAPETVTREGKPYANPNLGQLSASPCPLHYIPNQGKIFLAITAKPREAGGADITMHINEVPMSMDVASGWVPPKVARMVIGAYSGTSERHKTTNPWKGTGNGFFLTKKPLTQAQIHQRGRYMTEQLRLDGDEPGLRKSCYVGNGDSLTAFSPSYLFRLSDCTKFTDRLHIFNTAIGGSDIGAALAEPRKTAFMNIVRAAVQAGYYKVPVLARWGTNELLLGDPYSWLSVGNHTVWRDNYYLPFMAEVKAIAPDIVEIWHFTMPPRLGLGSDMTKEVANDLMIQAYNDDFRNNYQAYGLDRLIDMGLGTERMVSDGVFVPETRPGGRAMNNWRCANAARILPVKGVPSRAPSSALVLSAVFGSNITATADAGTFLFHDMYRKITAGTGGYGRIIGISADGARATLDTRDVNPTPWPNQNPGVTLRDQILRGGGYNTKNFSSGSWLIESCSEEWQTDGLHQAFFGGRQECDYIVPTIMAFEDTLSGVVM